MNADASESLLNSHICFNALATLQNIKNVEKSCNFCSSSDHETYMCPELSKGKHVKDTSTDNLSWSSVPQGLQIYRDATGSHIISVQKFAKGCRFGPFLSPKSYIPLENTKFPLKIFGSLDMEAMHMPELRDLFKVRHIYLDTRNEKYCNWMIHVDAAKYSNEQNLIAYEEDNEVFFAAIEDLDVGDILKVWYSPKYGEQMKMPSLHESPYPVEKNVLCRGGIALPEIYLFNNYPVYGNDTNRTEIMLPSIKTIIKPSSYVSYENNPSNTTNTNPNILYNSLMDHANDLNDNCHFSSAILNLDDNFSTDTEFNELMAYEDDTEKLEKILNTSTDCIASDMHMYSNTTSQNDIDKDEKKLYPCRLCDKKYSTMTNIYRHVRAQHNCFLCSLCMKMFGHEAELKEHIHKCPKSDVKKPQCVVCMQYFSNSWSLTRHIKIHISAGECDPDILIEKKAKDIKRGKDDSKEIFDYSDTEKNSQDGFLLGTITSMPETSIDPDLNKFCIDNNVPIVKEVTTVQTVSLDKLEISSSDGGTSISEKDIEISSCVVCNKKFFGQKSKSCMNKHLRSVHAVKILTGVKRSSSNNGHSKNHLSSKRSYLSESHSSITHTGSPVNPMTAKALASKLNERNNMLNGVKKASDQSNGNSNDVPMPPLISIKTISTSSVSGKLKDGDQPQQRCPTLQRSKFSQAKKTTTTHSISVNERNQQKNETLNKQSNESNSWNDLKLNPNNHVKMHKCDNCSKKFNKKYELKRHRTVHENITYKCPYCEKVVKRKPSILKHLKVVHKEEEHIWGDGSIILQLDKNTKSSVEGLAQSESSNTNESSTDERNNVSQKTLDNGENGEIYKNVFLSSDPKMASIDRTAFITSHPVRAISNTSEDDMSLLGAESTVELINDNRKRSVVNMTTQANLNNIIDDCFFGDDALNCNVVLVHSPFSSDNDVDGFTMTNENGGCIMNKELLNEFHDRLEEMEEKVDSNDFKTIWDHVLDEASDLNDDICTDDIDESGVA